MSESPNPLPAASIGTGSELAAPLDTAGHEELFSEQREEERLAILRRTQESGRLENLGLLAAGVAHDFNNLLSIIMGNVDLVEMDTGHLPEVSQHLRLGTVAGNDGAGGSQHRF